MPVVASQSLLSSEIARLKAELGFNLLAVGAEPYIGVTRYFEQIVLPNLQNSGLTTSATPVTAVPVGQQPASVTLALADSLAINIYDRVIVDVDSRAEEATVQSVSGLSIVIMLVKTHGDAGAYPVAIEGGISLVRFYLGRCRRIADRIERFGARAGVKKADEVEFFGGAHGRAAEPNGFRTLSDMQQYFRSELCKLLFGVGDISSFGNAGSRVGAY